MTECERLMSQYLNWLKVETTCNQFDGILEITTPFVDRHNDYLQIYVQRVGDKLRLTDDGFTMCDLHMCGCSLDSPKREELLDSIVSGFALSRDGHELYTEATFDTFAERKHALVQGMLCVNDLFLTAKQTVASLFADDVAVFLMANDIRFTPDIKLQGISGFHHRFDFVIPQSKEQPERILQAVTSPTKSNIAALLFSWTDTREKRKPGTRLYAVLNDTDKRPSRDTISALERYGIDPVPWSRRMAWREKWAS
jgi:hypothetical protein